MAYIKQTWSDLPNETTPVSAERLNHIEDGIYDNVVESGSNANGKWIKYSDGTMECYGQCDVQLSNSTGNTLKAFPQSFLNDDIVITQSPMKIGGNASLEVYRIVSGSRANSASNFYIYASFYLNTTANYLVNFNWMAIGRWK